MHTETKARVCPIIRVFVSSTFSDLKVERDALQCSVYPALEALCLRNGFQFQAIDLRWGVSAEASLDHRTMRICLEELRRSQKVSPQPNFLILLGNRYGWRPLPEEISAEEFQLLDNAACQQATNGGKSPTEVLRQWYRLDDNAITPTYVLQPRRKPAAGDQDAVDFAPAAAWREVETVLWAIINLAFPAEGLNARFDSETPGPSDMPQIVRFQGSATEQEIWAGALQVEDASNHVLAFFREIDPLPPTIDAQYRDFFDVGSGRIDQTAQTALRQLKAEIERRLDGNVLRLPAARLLSQTDGVPASVSCDHLDELCRQVAERLTAIIDRQIAEYWREPAGSGAIASESSSPQRTTRELEIEREEHLRFGNERGSKALFVGRDDQIRMILSYLLSNSTTPLVVHGGSGSGKTALLARALQEVSEKQKPLIRFIGITPRSSDIGALLRSLCEELRQRNPLEAPLSSDIRKLSQELRTHFEKATEETPIILFLDALDQLSDADNGRQMFWLPFGKLPGHVKMVVSCLSDREPGDPAGQPFESMQKRRLGAECFLNLEALSEHDASVLLFDRWLRSAGRRVNEAQSAAIHECLQGSDACRQPLYLKLLFEEVKLWRSYDLILPPGRSVPALLAQLRQRLSKPENHGEALLNAALGYIAAARRGVSEVEMLELLFADPTYKTQLDAVSQRNNHQLPLDPPRIPIAIWSRLRADLAPYLADRGAPGGNVLTLYHRQVAEWAKNVFVNEAVWNVHERLATYFRSKDYFLESLDEQRARARRLPPTPRPVNVRKVDELPYHVLEVAKLADPGSKNPQAKEWDAVADLLTDWQFLEAKAEANP